MASIVLRLLLLTIYLIGVSRLGADYSSLGKANSDRPVNGGSDEFQWSVLQNGNETSSTSKPTDQAGNDNESSLQRQSVEWTLLVASLVTIVNALTVLDVALSRPTKPWRFLLRIVYRFGRANLIKLSPVLLVFYATTRLECLNAATQVIGEFTRQAINYRHVHHILVACENNAEFLGFAFLAYALFIRWASLSFFGRPAESVNNEGEARYSSWSAGMSRWWLIIECIFRPVSLATAHTLADFDLELDETMDLFFERLVFPNLWLTPTVPADYLSYLPVWKSLGEDFSPPMSSSSGTTMKWISSNECAICLDKYRLAVDVCGLPCGHHFHETCIMSWLERDNHHCPICRWPAYRNKHLDALPYDLNEAPQIAAS